MSERRTTLPISPGPQRNTSPASPLGSQTRGSSTAVVSSVDASGKYATILVNNKIPGESGYIIPAGIGPWTQGSLGQATTLSGGASAGATTLTFNGLTGYSVGDILQVDYNTSAAEYVKILTLSGNTITCAAIALNHGGGARVEPSTTGYHFFYDNPAGDGGSICIADLDQRVITSVSNNVSQSAPTPFYGAVSDHKHTGLFNSATGIIDPNPIDIGSLKANPNPNQAPVLVGTVQDPCQNYPIISLTYAAEVAFELTIANPSWLAEVRTFAVLHGSAADPKNSPWNDFQPTATGSYTAIFDSLAIGKAYDLYCAFVDLQGNISPTLYLCQTVSDPVFIPATGLNHNPKPNTAPVITNATLTDTEGIGGGSTLETYTFQTDVTGNPNWLSAVRLFACPTGSSAAVALSFPNGDLGPETTGAYTASYTLASTATVSYDLYAAYVDSFGAVSPLALVNSATALNPVSAHGLAAMPNTSAPVQFAYFQNQEGVNNDIDVTGFGGGAYNITTSIFVQAADGEKYPSWLAEIELVYSHFYTSQTVYSWTKAGALSPRSDGSYSFANEEPATWSGLGAGNPYNIGVRFVDHVGGRSTVLLLTSVTGETIATRALSSFPSGTKPNQIQICDPFTYTPGTGGTFDATTTIYLDNVGTTDSSWLAEIELVAAIDSTNPAYNVPSNWAHAGVQAPYPAVQSNTAGIYTVKFGHLGQGNTYDLGIRYVDHQGNRTDVAVLQYLASNGGLLQTMPATIINNGPTIINQSEKDINNGAASYQASFSIQVTDWTAGHTPGWLAGVKVYTRIHGQVASTDSGVLPPDPASTTYTGTIGGLGAGASYDLGFAYLDLTGNHSKVTWPPNMTTGPNQAPGSALAPAQGVNLIADSDMASLGSTAFDGGFFSNYWTGAFVDSTRFFMRGSALNCDNGNNSNATVNATAYSEPIGVTAGVTYTLSCMTALWIGNHGGQSSMGIVSVVDKTANNTQPQNIRTYAGLPYTTGSQTTKTWTATATETICIALWVTSLSGTATFTLPQFEIGATATAYKPGANVTEGGTLAAGGNSPNVQNTIGASPGSDNSYLVPGIISAAHFIGNPSSDRSQVMSGGTMLYSRHAQSIQNTIVDSGGVGLDNVRNGQSYSRVSSQTVATDGSGYINLAQGGFYNKSQSYIANDAGQSSISTSYTNGNRPIINLADGIHSNVNGNYIPYPNGQTLSSLQPSQYGADYTAYNTSNDVHYGNGRTVAQYGADATGSNVSYNVRTGEGFAVRQYGADITSSNTANNTNLVGVTDAASVNVVIGQGGTLSFNNGGTYGNLPYNNQSPSMSSVVTANASLGAVSMSNTGVSSTTNTDGKLVVGFNLPANPSGGGGYELAVLFFGFCYGLNVGLSQSSGYCAVFNGLGTISNTGTYTYNPGTGGYDVSVQSVTFNGAGFASAGQYVEFTVNWISSSGYNNNTSYMYQPTLQVLAVRTQ